MKTSLKIGYGIGQSADGIKTAAFSTFLFFYYNQVLGLSGSLAGMAALLALLVDAITDPMIGQLSDRFNSRWGRRHPFMLAGAIPFAAAMIALFSPPTGMGEMALFCWMLGWAIVVRLTLTLFFVPHLSLGAEMVRDYHERTKLISFRVFFSYAGVLVTTVLGFALFFPSTETYQNGMLNADSYTSFGFFVGLTGMIVMLISVFSTRSVIPTLSKAAHDPQAKNAFFAFITVFVTLKEHAFRILFLATLMFMIVAGVSQTLLLYVSSYIFEFTSEHLAILSSSVILSIFVAPMVAQNLSSKIDKKNTLAVCVFAGGMISAFPFFLYFLDLFQPLSISARLTIVFVGNAIAQSFFIAYIIILDSMLSDTIDVHEQHTAKREEGLFFAARSLATKASFGLGSFFAGVALDIINFPKNTLPVDMPAAAVNNLAVLAGPVLLALFMITIVISSRYPLTSASHREVLRAIAENKQELRVKSHATQEIS
ncbi:MFS transporter [Zhongshania sp.]|uniref:MFS transporter n=1 Tax=Zhongshania sp. TaxID=1971902 RepID=UPI0039E618FE